MTINTSTASYLDEGDDDGVVTMTINTSTASYLDEGDDDGVVGEDLSADDGVPGQDEVRDGTLVSQHVVGDLLVRAQRGLRVVGAAVKEHAAKEQSVLFNDALNTFYLRLYGVKHVVKDH